MGEIDRSSLKVQYFCHLVELIDVINIFNSSQFIITIVCINVNYRNAWLISKPDFRLNRDASNLEQSKNKQGR